MTEEDSAGVYEKELLDSETLTENCVGIRTISRNITWTVHGEIISSFLYSYSLALPLSSFPTRPYRVIYDLIYIKASFVVIYAVLSSNVVCTVRISCGHEIRFLEW